MKKRDRTKVARRSSCPVSFALDLLGDRWTLLIVRDFVFSGKSAYTEFLESDEGIATNILADRLMRLECAGVIKKLFVRASQSRTRYKLTEKGIDLVPVLIDLALWGAKYDPKTGAPHSFVERATHDRKAFISEITSSLRSRFHHS